MATNAWIDLPSSSGGGVGTNVNIHDSLGNNLTSTAGSLNVNVTNSSSPTSTTGTPTQIALTTASQTALAANSNRKGAIFVNDSINVTNLGFFTPVTSSSYSIKLRANSTYEMATPVIYTGIVTVISSANSGFLVVTEFT